MNKFNKCFKLDKAAIVEAIQSGMAEPNAPAVQEINAQVSGFIPTLGDNTIGLFGYHGPFGYDTNAYPEVPQIGPVVNPACGNGDNDDQFGTLVINPNLPAGSSAQFDLNYTLLDNSAGGGSFILFCPSTGQFTGVQGAASGAVGVEQTQSFDASSLDCAIEDVLIGITAWGANSNPIYDGNCDQISEEVGTLVVVTENQCAPALDCFAQIFGCSLFEMMEAAGLSTAIANQTIGNGTDGNGADLSAIEAKLDSFTKIVWSFEYPERGARWAMWTGEQYAPHRPVGEIFNQPGGAFGTGAHVLGAATHGGLTNDLNFNDNVLLGADPIAREGDQILVWGYVEFLTDGFMRDNNANTGETGRVWLGSPSGCCDFDMELIEETNVNTPAADRVILHSTPVKAGIYPMVIQMSDLSAFQGFDLEFSTDEESWANHLLSYVDMPCWTPRVVPCDYVLIEGETLVPQTQCCKEEPYDPVVEDGSLVGGVGDASPTLPAADRKVVSDNFQDQQNVQFNLQVRNATSSTVNWEAVAPNKPYSTIPSLQLNGAALVTQDNGDGTFTHLFSGSDLAGFQNITITGGIVTPSGDGSGLSLYCQAV